MSAQLFPWLEPAKRPEEMPERTGPPRDAPPPRKRRRSAAKTQRGAAITQRKSSKWPGAKIV